MRLNPSLQLRPRATFSLVLISLASSFCAGQAARTPPSRHAPGSSRTAPAPDNPLSQEMKKNPELFTEFARLYEKMQQDVQFPPQRSTDRKSTRLNSSHIPL